MLRGSHPGMLCTQAPTHPVTPSTSRGRGQGHRGSSKFSRAAAAGAYGGACDGDIAAFALLDWPARLGDDRQLRREKQSGARLPPVAEAEDAQGAHPGMLCTQTPTHPATPSTLCGRGQGHTGSSKVSRVAVAGEYTLSAPSCRGQRRWRPGCKFNRRNRRVAVPGACAPLHLLLPWPRSTTYWKQRLQQSCSRRRLPPYLVFP